MAFSHSAVLSLLTSSVLAALVLGSGSGTYGCQSSSECPTNECCMLDLQRYAIPTCTKMRQLGENCRPNNLPTSQPYYYPGQPEIQLSDVYVSLCDCAPNLTCDRTSGTCQPDNNNYL